MGDPDYRGMSNLERDPMIPQRMREIVRSQLCVELADAFNQCGKEAVSLTTLFFFPVRDLVLQLMVCILGFDFVLQVP